VGALEINRYGNAIPLKTLEDTVSLRINGVDEIGPNPHRNKQHAFHFTADNCIGCHACEAACSEKNDLPAHISFRSVGYVEGGTYPNYQRLNISMACNHCDDPVCLKGCPTRAYTKHEEYGAVIQDPDICFGCGYCTWVCPYNAPQLDPVAGQVEKCNMCVDRLEVGLKPACVTACVGNALDFGVVENKPEHREQLNTQLPGFPDPSITQPNIRFQQIKTLPKEVTRTDSAPIKYQKNSEGVFKPVVDQKVGKEKHWNLARLSSRENPLVIFTLSAQAAVGIFLTLFIGDVLAISPITQIVHSVMYLPLLIIAIGLTGLGLLMSTIHLGKPLRFYRGFNNLRHSPVSREGLGIVVFMACVGLHFLATVPATVWVVAYVPALLPFQHNAARLATWMGALAVPAGLIALYYMYRCYCIKARPFWNHWHAAATFFGNMLNLGALVIAAVVTPYLCYTQTSYIPLLSLLSMPMLAGMAVEALALFFHARDMNVIENEGAASHYIQCTTFGFTYYTRNVLLLVNILAVLALSVFGQANLLTVLGWAVVLFNSVTVALVGRALFYVLVIPTTMPGAFFWKNKAFEQHARDIGLAEMPQVGVVTESQLHGHKPTVKKAACGSGGCGSSTKGGCA
jgi:DMSO reductase iron-sulfur subunit